METLSVASADSDPISGAVHLDLTDEETAALTQELHDSDKIPILAEHITPESPPASSRLTDY
jgi:hypothetical protein